MDFTVVPSLEDITLVKIAVRLWNSCNNDDFKSTYYATSIKSACWYEIEDKVRKFRLPKSIKQKLSYFVVAIGGEIVTWKTCCNNICKSQLKQEVSKIHWTPQGTVNKRLTVEALVREENLDICLRFKLACTFCLEDDIHTLYNQLSKKEWSIICYKCMRPYCDLFFVSFWTCAITGKLDEKEWNKYCISDTAYEYAFRHALTCSNEVAARYFLKKLTTDQRNKILVEETKCISKNVFMRNRRDFPLRQYSVEVLCFLLSLMNEEQQMEIFETNMRTVLYSLLNWPWQNFFIPTAQCMITRLSYGDYCFLFATLWGKIAYHKDYDYRSLSAEFLCQSSPTYKKEAMSSGCLFRTLCEVKDKKVICEVLKDATVAEKEHMVFAFLKGIYCTFLAYHCEWDKLSFLIEECVRSPKSMMKVRNQIQMHLMHGCERGRLKKRQKCEKFLQLVDNMGQNIQRRKEILPN